MKEFSSVQHKLPKQGTVFPTSVSIPSANEPAKDVILVHTVQLKPMIKVHISARMVSSGISDVAIISHSLSTLPLSLREWKYF